MADLKCLAAIAEKRKATIKDGQEEVKATVCVIWEKTEGNQEKMVIQTRAH
jgi:hypothetical protein